MKSTKGKWRYSKYTQAVFSLDKNNEADKGICTILQGHRMSKEESIANTKLISKAPEMLVALKDIIERYPNSPWIIDRLKSLINEIES